MSHLPVAPASPISGWSAPSPLAQFARLTRLTGKELREILRDRRTIVTLVLMPLLLYPLLSVGLRQVFATSLPGASQASYRIAVASEGDWTSLTNFLNLGAARRQPGEPPIRRRSLPREEWVVDPNLEKVVRNYVADVAVRLRDTAPNGDDGFAIDLELIYRQDSLLAPQVVDYIEGKVAAANFAYLDGVLKRSRIPQRAEPVRAISVPLPDSSEATSVTLLTLVPLILILMTITGAVYPAIDLTAGERERGTLEILVAAPVPRLALLLAKYFAVLTVALLTAAVNLTMMTLTVMIGGMGPLLFGESGLSPLLVFQVLGLLLLFATFFSALLLTLTSFARSFKEAQAYLIPLMMVAIAPGLMSLAPELRLEGPLSIAPLINIVLLGRDVLEHTAEAPMVAVVVVSTLLYALSAIAVAARTFAAEAVLYSTESGWADLFRRPRAWRDAATPAGALTCLALAFPGIYVAAHMIARLGAWPMAVRLLAMSAATAGLFALFPFAAADWRRVRARTAFRFRWGIAPWAAWPAAVLLGLSLWPAAHELILLQWDAGWVNLSDDRIRQAQEMLAQWRELPMPLLLVAVALTPAVCEELFFRGYLFSALAGRMRPAGVIVATAVLFGVFHMITPSGVAFERLATSTLLGLFLGYVAWRADSIWPSMLLHSVHNGLLVLLAYYQPRLSAAGLDIHERAHLPLAWLAASASAVLVGVGIATVFCRRR